MSKWAPRCNIIDRNDAFNMAVVCSRGQWVGDLGGLACNAPAVAIGEWRKYQGRIAFVYPCMEHYELLNLYDFEPATNRGWFMKLGKVKL
jgi:hypothetical protein